MIGWRTYFWRFWPWKRSIGDEKTPMRNSESFVNRFDQYALILESIVMWDNPFVSAACVVLVNLIFWFIYSYERKFYCVLALVVWMILFYNFWSEHLYPFIKTKSKNCTAFVDWCNRNCRTPGVKEDGQYYFQLRACMSKFYSCMVKLRLEYPGLFCVWTLVFLTAVAATGQAVPGLPMAYAASMLVLVGPGIVLHVLPSAVTARINAFHHLLFRPAPRGDLDEVEEYLPESSKEALAVLSLVASNVSAGTMMDEDSFIPEGDLGNHTNGADSSSHVSVLDLELDVLQMPPHDEHDSLEGSVDAPEEFSLLPHAVDGILGAQHVRRRTNAGRGDGAMRFESMHFEQGSSSDEDELSLKRHFSSDGKAEAVVGTQVGQLLGQWLASSGAVASVVRLAAQQSSRREDVRRDESDEDFEMISKEELS